MTSPDAETTGVPDVVDRFGRRGICGVGGGWSPGRSGSSQPRGTARLCVRADTVRAVGSGTVVECNSGVPSAPAAMLLPGSTTAVYPVGAACMTARSTSSARIRAVATSVAGIVLSGGRGGIRCPGNTLRPRRRRPWHGAEDLVGDDDARSSRRKTEHACGAAGDRIPRHEGCHVGQARRSGRPCPHRRSVRRAGASDRTATHCAQWARQTYLCTDGAGRPVRSGHGVPATSAASAVNNSSSLAADICPI